MPADIGVMLGDSMGEIPAYCAASDVAFIGGSLLPLGGQNLIEALAVGTPVVVGPHTFNFADATAGAIAAGAAMRVADAAALIGALAALLDDPPRRHQMGEAARALSRRCTGGPPIASGRGSRRAWPPPQRVSCRTPG